MQLYPTTNHSLVFIFDIRLPGVARRLHLERAAWGASGDIEALDEHHFALVIRPGGARRLA